VLKARCGRSMQSTFVANHSPSHTQAPKSALLSSHKDLSKAVVHLWKFDPIYHVGTLWAAWCGVCVALSLPSNRFSDLCACLNSSRFNVSTNIKRHWEQLMKLVKALIFRYGHPPGHYTEARAWWHPQPHHLTLYLFPARNFLGQCYLQKCELARIQWQLAIGCSPRALGKS